MVLNWKSLAPFWLKFLRKIRLTWIFWVRSRIICRTWTKVRPKTRRFRPNYTTICRNNLKNFLEDILMSRIEMALVTKFSQRWRNKWPATKKKLKTCRRWKLTWQLKITKSWWMISINCTITTKCINIWAKNLRQNFLRATTEKELSSNFSRKQMNSGIKPNNWKKNTTNSTNKVKPISIWAILRSSLRSPKEFRFRC